MADLFGKMADMQQQMADTQARLADQTVTAEAGGGMVTVVANGNGHLVSVKIDPEAVDKADVEMLEDLVVAGVNKALEQAEALKAQGMQAAAASMLPPGMDLGALGLSTLAGSRIIGWQDSASPGLTEHRHPPPVPCPCTPYPPSCI